MMTAEQYLLGVLGEECAELAKIASKASRFGTDDVKPGLPEDKTNAVRMVEEYADLIAVFAMVASTNPYMREVIEKRPHYVTKLIDAKKTKVEEMMKISRQKGRVE